MPKNFLVGAKKKGAQTKANITKSQNGKERQTKASSTKKSTPIKYRNTSPACLFYFTVFASSFEHRQCIRRQAILVEHWSRCFLRDPTINFDPNDRKARQLQHVFKGESNQARFELSATYGAPKYIPSNDKELQFTDSRKNFDDICVVDWSKVANDMAFEIAEASSIRCQELLFLMIVYASPLNVFVKEDTQDVSLTWQQKTWFIGCYHYASYNLEELLKHADRCLEFFRFMGIHHICHMFDQESYCPEEKRNFLTKPEIDQFTDFVKFLQTHKRAVA